jgi:hypothetical protein
LEIEIAEELLVLLLGENGHASKFSEFLQQQTTYKVLNLDQWFGFLEFAKIIGSFDADFEGYDVQDPCLTAFSLSLSSFPFFLIFPCCFFPPHILRATFILGPVILDEFVVWCRSSSSRHPVLRSDISTVEVM